MTHRHAGSGLPPTMSPFSPESPMAQRPLYAHPDPMARSFYEQLAQQGFTYEQIVDLAAQLLDLVVRERRRLATER